MTHQRTLHPEQFLLRSPVLYPKAEPSREPRPVAFGLGQQDYWLQRYWPSEYAAGEQRAQYQLGFNWEQTCAIEAANALLRESSRSKGAGSCA